MQPRCGEVAGRLRVQRGTPRVDPGVARASPGGPRLAAGRAGPRVRAGRRPVPPRPWAARNAYIAVILARTPDAVRAFLDAHGRPGLDAEGRVHALRLLEMQRHALLMYTSCGWFFDELTGLETVQILKYAARALQLAEGFGERLEDEFVGRLAAA